MRTNRLLGLVLFAFSSIAFAAPIGNRLLSMVPAGVQIVTGIRIPLQGVAISRTNFVTRNNNVDFEDWASLAAADPHAQGEQAVEVAASSARGELKERLLLVDGAFDSEAILQAARRRSVGTASFAGVRVVIVAPFTRDDPTAVGLRWLAFPDERTAVFGTPLLVQQALLRHQQHTPVEPTLTAHLQQLRAGAREWGVLDVPAALLRRHLPGIAHTPALLEAMNQPGDLILGVHPDEPSSIVVLGHADPSEDLASVSR